MPKNAFGDEIVQGDQGSKTNSFGDPILMSPGSRTAPMGLNAKEKEENARPVDYAGIRRAALPMAGGVAAGLFTGGLSIPAAMGVTALGGGLGSSIEQGIEKFRGEEQAPKSPGEAALRIGTDAAEQGAAELGGRVVTGTLEKVLGRYLNPERLYQSGLKPAGVNETKALKSVKTGIKEKVPLTEKAAGMVRNRINDLNSQIEQVVQATPSNIPPSSYVKNVTGKLDSLRKTWGKDATHGEQFVNQLDSMERQFLIQHANPAPLTKTVTVPSEGGLVGHDGKPLMVTKQVTISPEDMSLAELRQQARPLDSTDAQAIKKATYETIRTSKQTAWDSNQHPALSVRANQEVARALKQELEKAYPDIKKLNAREGALIELENQLQRFAKREMNKQNLPYIPFVLGGAVLGTMHGEGATSGAMAGAIIKHMLENPAVKARIAIALDAAGKLPGKQAAKYVGKQIPKTAIRAGVAAASPGSNALPEN